MKHKKLLSGTLTAFLVVMISGALLLRMPTIYGKERINKIASEYYLYGLENVESVKTNIWSADFQRYTAGQTQIEEIYEMLGNPHASSGSGFESDVYFTKDNQLVFICSQEVVLNIWKVSLKTCETKEITFVDDWGIED